MKSRKTKTATKKMWTSDANFAELLKYLKAMHKAARTQTVGTAMLRMADVPEVVRPLTERLRAEDQLVRAESAARYSSTVFGAALDPPDLTDLRSHSSYPNSCPRSPIGLSARTKSHLVKYVGHLRSV
jgi:hypothetical protein